MTNIIDEVNKWFRPKKPDTIPLPTPDDITRTPYLRAWALVRNIDLKALWPVFVSVPAIVFFAISGVLAWVVLFFKFLLSIFRLW